MDKKRQWTIRKSEEKGEIITPRSDSPSYINKKWREWDLPAPFRANP